MAVTVEQRQLANESLGVYALLHQSRIWYDQQYEERRIENMDPWHARNVCRFLLRRAEPLFWMYQIGLAVAEPSSGSPAAGMPFYPDAFNPSVPLADPVEKAHRWLRDTPLYRALELRAGDRLV